MQSQQQQQQQQSQQQQSPNLTTNIVSLNTTKQPQQINQEKSEQIKQRKKDKQIIQQSQKKETRKQQKIAQQVSQLSYLQAELLDMGFQKKLINQTLKITQNRDKAIQYIITTLQNQQKQQQEKLRQKQKQKTQKGIRKMQMIQQNYPKKMQQKQAEQDDGFQDEQQDYKMIFLVRMDLKMGLGKIAAQVAHATLRAYKQMVYRANQNDIDFVALQQWKQLGQKKIVVKVNDQKQLLQALNKASSKGMNNCYIRDAGLTQIASGSITVGAIGPAPSSEIDTFTKSFKLL